MPYPGKSQFIAITFADDTVGVMQFVVSQLLEDGREKWHREPSDENIEAEIKRSMFDADKLPIKGWTRIKPHEIPTDRTFRAAWRHGPEGFTHDLDHCRRIRLGRIREKRNADLAALDVETMRAVGAQDTKRMKEVEEQKQTLRDLPATLADTLAKADTPEAIAQVRM